MNVFTLADVDCKSEVDINFEVSKNQSKPFIDIDCKVPVVAVKNTQFMTSTAKLQSLQ